MGAGLISIFDASILGGSGAEMPWATHPHVFAQFTRCVFLDSCFHSPFSGVSVSLAWVVF